MSGFEVTRTDLAIQFLLATLDAMPAGEYGCLKQALLNTAEHPELSEPMRPIYTALAAVLDSYETDRLERLFAAR